LSFPALSPREGKFWKLILSAPPQRPVCAAWEKQRIERQEKAAKAQEAHAAMKIADYAAKVKALADLKEWEDLKPMVSDVDWVARLKTDNPTMYQELKYRVGDIWGKSAKEVWRVYAQEK